MEALPDVPAIAKLRVGQDRPGLEAPGPHAIQAGQRQCGFRLVLDRRRDPHLGPAARIGGPAFREEEGPGERHRRRVGPEVDAHRHLAVRRLPQGPAVLAGDADGVGALFGEARGVEQVHGLWEERIHHGPGQGRLDRLPGPGALVHELAEGLRVGPGEPGGHRLDGLPLAIQEEAPDVHAGPVLAFGAAHVRHHFGEKGGQALLGGVELFGIHAASVRRPGYRVNCYLTE